MNEITFYAYTHHKLRRKEQIFITIDCKNKSFKTNKEQNGSIHSRYGFSCIELKNYGELKHLEQCLIYKGFKCEKLD